MNKQLIPRLILPVALLALSITGNTQTVSFTVLNGDEIRCMTDSTVQIEITPNPSLTLSQISLNWGDGSDVETILPGDPLMLSHTYLVSEMGYECEYGANCTFGNDGICQQVSILAEYTDGPQENNSKELTFQFPPEADFSFGSAIVCEGNTVDFENESCPNNDPTMTYEWVLYNDTISTEANPTDIFEEPGTYTVQLTATNQCGTETLSDVATQVINVQELPQAEIAIDSGGLGAVSDVDTICLNSGGAVRFNGDGSSAAFFYEWGISPGSGYNLLSSLTDDTLRVDFTQAGTYEVDLSVDNTCQSADATTVEVVVLPLLSLDLQPQADSCGTLSYTPDPLEEGATYEIDGSVYTAEDFPITLNQRQEPYIVTARRENRCQSILLRDTFMLAAPIDPAPISPTADTVICADSTDLPLLAGPASANVRWEGEGVSFSGGDYVFESENLPSGDYELAMLTGSGDCLRSDTLTITVNNLQIDVGGDESLCRTLGEVTLAASPGGGTWSGPGIVDSVPNRFNTLAAQAGENQLVYEFTDTGGTGCTVRRSKTIEIVEEPTLALDSLLELCDVDAALDLADLANANASPAGEGTFEWLGDGITDSSAGTYNPAQGTHGESVQAIYSLLPGCADTASVAVNIQMITPADAGADTSGCLSEPSLSLSGNPASGSWTSGSGAPAISDDGVIDLSAGPSAGSYTYTYTVFPGTSCEDSDEVQVELVEGGGVSVPPEVFVCDTAAALQLPAGAPAGGVWEGNALQAGDVVDLTQLNPGTHPYQYELSSLPPACNTADLSLNLLPQPEASFANDSTSCQQSDCVEFTNASSGAGDYSWDYGDGSPPEEGVASPCHVYDAAGEYSVSLLAYALSSDGNRVCSDTAFGTAHIIAPPASTVLLPSDTTICPDETVAFNQQSQGEELSFEWQFDTLGSSSEAVPPAQSFPPGLDSVSYEVVLTASNSCGSVADQQAITVLPLPVANFGVNFAAPCSGDTLQIQNASTGGPSQVGWFLSSNNTNGSYSTYQPPAIVPFTGDEPDTISVLLAVANSCGADSLQQPVVVQPTDVEAFISQSDQEACPGEPVRFISFSTPGAPVRWELSTGDPFLGDTLTHVFDSSGTYEITLFAEGCGYDSTVAAIEIQEAPSGSLDYEAAACEGQEVSFELESNAAAQVLYFGDGDSTLLANATHRYDSLDVFPVRAVLRSSQGCTSTLSGNIEIVAGPVAAAAAPDSVCAGAPLSLLSESSGAESCRWWIDGENVLDACQGEAILQAPGSYTGRLVAISNLGCRDTAGFPLYVRPSPDASFEPVAEGECTPIRVRFLNTTPPANATSYFWQFGDGANSNLESPVHLYREGGALEAALIASYEQICFDTARYTLQLNETPRFDTLLTDERCQPGEPYILEVETEASHSISLWGDNFFQDGRNRFEITVPGEYELDIVSLEGCDTSLQLRVPAVQPIVLELMPDTTILFGQSVPMRGQVNTVDLAFQWSPPAGLSDFTAFRPLATPFQTTNYLLTATDGNCSVSEEVRIEVLTERRIYFPNAFSPNEDGTNDLYRIFPGPGVEAIEAFEIYTRWGERVYQTTGLDATSPAAATDGLPTWDGKLDGELLNPAVFAYYARLRLVNGERTVVSGDIQLVR